MSYKLQLIIGDTRTSDGAHSKVRQLLKIINKNLAQIQDHNIYIDFCEAKRGGKFYHAAVKARIAFPVLNDFALSKSIAGEQDILSYIENLCQCGGGGGGQGSGMEDPESTFEEMYENTPEELQGTAYKDYMSSTMMNEDGSSWREHALYASQNKRAKNMGKKGAPNPGQGFTVQDDEEDAFSGYSKEDADKKMRKFMSRRAKYGMDSVGNNDDDDDDDDTAGFDGPRRAQDFPESKAPRRKKRRHAARPRIQRSAKSTRMQVAPENEEERLFANYWNNREESNI